MTDKLAEICATKRDEVAARKPLASLDQLDARAAGQSAPRGFEAALRRHFGALADWQTPAGGLFFWVTLKRPVDTRLLLPAALARGVVFMPGEAFYPDAPGATGTLRLNFSHAAEADMDRGLAVLAELVAAAG